MSFKSPARLMAVARKELIQLRRDRMTLAMMAVLPVMQLLLFGYAINTDVRHTPTAVLDDDRSSRSRAFVRAMVATGFYDITGEVRDHDELSRALRAGRARAAIVIPAGFSSEVARGRTGHLQFIVDGSDPQTVASASGTAASLAASWGSRLAVERLAAQGLRMPPPAVTLEPLTWYNPDLRTAIFVVPGLVGVLLTMTMVMLTAMAITRERERGTLEQLIVSPVKPFELVAGKILPYILIGYVQMSLVLAVGHLAFHVPVVGSLGLLYALAALFIAANLALGLTFSTVAQTQQQAMQMSFFFMLPNMLLSGFMFPWEAMPRPVQVLSQALPLTHFLRIVRGITLKGASWSDMRVEVLWMAGILAWFTFVASVRFRKKLG